MKKIICFIFGHRWNDYLSDDFWRRDLILNRFCKRCGLEQFLNIGQTKWIDKKGPK